MKPVDDATFKGYLALYEYDHTPLDVNVASSDSSEANWIREAATVSEPGGGRLPMVMFLPRRARPPYQAAVMWPASDAFIVKDPAQLPMWIVDFIMRSGRALVYPVYAGILGRSVGADAGSGVIATRDLTIRRTKEMRRAIDYALSRGDVDSTRIAYVGASWGARIGGTVVAVEPRRSRSFAC